MTLLKLHAEPLKDEWLDAYGHLNEAYYLVPFSNGNWALQEHFGARELTLAWFTDRLLSGQRSVVDFAVE